MLELEQETRRWTVSDAADLYEVAGWGKGYFSINPQGHVCIHPNKDPGRAIDLKQLVDRLQVRGIQTPVLIRFGDIFKHRLGEIHAAFQQAIKTVCAAVTSAFSRSKSINSGRSSKNSWTLAGPIILG